MQAMPRVFRWSGSRRASATMRRATFVGASILALIASAAVFAPLIAQHDPLALNLTQRLMSPTWSHPFGTDELGRDNLSRVVYGGRLTLVTASVAIAVAGTIGTSVGLVSGYFGGLIDDVMSRAMELLLAIPAILLAITIVAILGPSRTSALAAVSVVGIPQYARLARASALSLREREFVLASISLGAGHARVILRSILPNSLSPIIVQCAITGATAVLLESALSFLGLGAQPPTPSWGLMLSSARTYLQQSPWYGLFPGIAISLTVVSFDMLARGINNALSVRSD